MARLVPITVSIFGSLVACREAVKPQPLAQDNLMVLEVGNHDWSLAHGLRTPPRGAKRPVVPRQAPNREPGGATRPPRRNPPQLRPEPQPEAEFHVVTLHQGHTLYGLCREHLGSGARWKEVASLNGWSEAQASNLRAGQKVKLPRR